jgi:hypothetical protein
VGVNLNDSYTEILSSTLAMPSIKINQLGVSIRWQLRHILNSTFQAGDLVIWQIPPASRFSIKHENINLPVETSLKDTKKEFFYSVTQDQLIFDHLSLLNYGVMFLRAQSIKFRIILHEDSSNLFPILDEITKYPEFVYIPQWIIDVGSDNLHPGKLSHKLVAKTILDNL